MCVVNRVAGAPLPCSAELLRRLPRIRQSTTTGEPPPEMDLSLCEKLLLEDSSDSDDSDVETMLHTFRQQSLVMALAVKEHEDENRKRRRASTVGRICISRNPHLNNEMLMRDYFAASPTYLLHLFRRRTSFVFKCDIHLVCYGRRGGARVDPTLAIRIVASSVNILL
ncbi:DNA-directed RNA polymerase 3, chloroplastic [Hordeum vulgare]|nr:DNA-directed RNA polymerase 3, chloroplastic [Hordeum vulgare]